MWGHGHQKKGVPGRKKCSPEAKILTVARGLNKMSSTRSHDMQGGFGDFENSSYSEVDEQKTHWVGIKR